MRFSIPVGIFLALTSTTPWAARFNMNSWILIFEPDKKIISQMVTYSYQGTEAPRDPNSQGSPEKGAENAPVPVEVNLSAREVSLDGKVIYPSSQGADNFVVYPSQFILYPGDSKRVQVQWVGTAPLTKETAYGFISTQIPLDLDKKKNTAKPTGLVNIASRYEGIIVVRPKGVVPMVGVDSAYAQTDSQGTIMVVLLNNKGTGAQKIKDMSLSILPLDKNGKGKRDEIKRIKSVPSSTAIGQSLFPGFRRKITLPWPAGLPVGPVIVSAEFPVEKK